MTKSLIIASTSTLHGGKYLEYLLDELQFHFKNSQEIVFIPYARPSGIGYNEYTVIAANAFSKINKKIIGIQEFKDPKEALIHSQGVFVGGGNTFVLLNELYKLNLVETIKNVVNKGIPYLGTSAGSNICGVTIGTTNDMPIVYPPSFNALDFVPFNINPHYLDPDTNSTHMGETRETRIKEFHGFNKQSVIGLREGSWLHVEGSSIVLKGTLTARWFQPNTSPIEIDPNSELNHLFPFNSITD